MDAVSFTTVSSVRSGTGVARDVLCAAAAGAPVGSDCVAEPWAPAESAAVVAVAGCAAGAPLLWEDDVAAYLSRNGS